MRKSLVCFVMSVLLVSSLPSIATDPANDFSPTPALACGAGDLPEVIQGRVPKADFDSGRAAQGYTCNAEKVSQVGSQDGGTGASGGYRVHRYTSANGITCAYYDTTLLFPANASPAVSSTKGSGVWVLDMSDPANPIHTATLSTPAMQSPHESFSLNTERGLLGAVFANPLFYHGQFDLYDASADCRYPVLKSTLPMWVLGHEGSFSPDGLTYYSSSLYGHTLSAIDVTNTLAPTMIWASTEWNVHGMNINEAGDRLYFADKGRNGAEFLPQAGTVTKGLTILDVSQVKARVPNPEVNIVSHLSWNHISTPQTNLPVRINGRSYLIEVDEFGSGDNVGAARIIDIEDETQPKVVSNIRLAVNNADHQNDGSQSKDPNATNSLAGYTGHYCGVPTTVNPGIVACTFILSGLRVFDIRDPQHPVEIAYFNMPATVDKLAANNPPYGKQGSYAMSQPSFDVARKQIWYSDGNSGFYVVQIKNGVWN